MLFTIQVSGFETWRDYARQLLGASVRPEDVLFMDQSPQASLFEQVTQPVIPQGGSEPVRVPKSFVGMAETVAAHRATDRWALLYRVLWRLTHGEADLLKVTVDTDVHRMLMLDKQVHFDAHKMKAFVRFRKVGEEDGVEQFIAWHKPEHRVLRMVAPFFARRFGVMRWSLLTPDESAHWDGHEVKFTEGVPRSAAPSSDELEELWKTYYRNIFNPARIKLKAMQKEMPRNYWATMPETELIPDLLAEAPQRVAKMVSTASKKLEGAEAYLPAKISLPTLREAVQACRGCDIGCHATQAVFGEGPEHALAMFVGEQPGDNEDLQGRPFVGPAGAVFDEALMQVGIRRDEVYVTNAVKHFKFEPRGHRRIHSKPSAREMQACKPWVEAELGVVQPAVLVMLGSTAAQTLIGPQFRITRDRGKVFESKWSRFTIATFHPSALLRIPDEAMKEESKRQFLEDMKRVAELMAMARSQSKAA
ncbi:MAG TPA: UdgX family uracil-DNA binding protein [Tepidisphaeraceae bacterium]|jgi:DNA polymerase